MLSNASVSFAKTETQYANLSNTGAEQSSSTEPSTEPSAEPSPSPSTEPSSEPSPSPGTEPSTAPSTSPGSEPSPSASASVEPSAVPSAQPSETPSMEPSPAPSAQPSVTPSSQPNAGLSGSGLDLTAVEGDFSYELINSGAEAEVTGYKGSGTSITIPDTMGGKPVTGIGNNAFQWNYTVTSVTLPNSIKTIGNYAFDHSAVSSINLPSDLTSIGNYAFYSAPISSSITIPAKVTNIGEFAFVCSNLSAIGVDSANPVYSSVDGILFNKDQTTLLQYPCGKPGSTYSIPANVTSLGKYSFSYSRLLETVVIPDTISVLDKGVFYGCYIKTITLPDNINSIGECCFFDCNFLTSITIPAGVTTIGPMAFASSLEASRLVYAHFEGNANSFDTSMFNKTPPNFTIYYNDASLGWSTPAWNGYKCLPYSKFANPEYDYRYSNNKTEVYILKYLGDEEQVTIPETIDGLPVTSVTGFSNTIVKNLTIPAGIKLIGWQVFSDSTGLESINVDPLNLNYSSLDGVLYDKTQNQLIQYPAKKAGVSFTIPGSVTSIGDSAFAYCSNLTNIDLNSVRNIGMYSFRFCTGLISVEIPVSTSYMYSNAFDDCDNLTAINVDGANTYYSSQDGVLFSKDYTILRKYPQGKTNTSYCVPTGVLTIYNDAFYKSRFLSVTIPDSLGRKRSDRRQRRMKEA